MQYSIQNIYHMYYYSPTQWNISKLQCIGKIDYSLPWSLPFHLFFLTVYYNVVYKHKSMQWRHWSVCISLCDINIKGVEIGERQNRCHNNTVSALLSRFNVSFCKTLELKKYTSTHCRWLGRRSRWQVFTCCLSTIWWHYRYKYTPRLWNRFVVIFEK